MFGLFRKVANVHVTAKLYAYSASDSIWIGPINFWVSSSLLCAWILLRSDSIYRYTMQLAGSSVRRRTSRLFWVEIELRYINKKEMAFILSHFSVISSNTLPELNDCIPVLCRLFSVVVSSHVKKNDNPQYLFQFLGMRNSRCSAQWLVTIKIHF